MFKNIDQLPEIIVSTFLLDDMEFGIDVSAVREALFFSGKILKMPTALDIFEGVINLRGSIIPVLNMRKRFGLPEHQDLSPKCIAIVCYKNRYIGLIFDNISQVLRMKNEDVSSFEKNTDDDYFSNQGALLIEQEDRLLQVLDLDVLFKNCQIPLIDNENIDSRRKFLEIKQDITFILDEQEYALSMNDIQEIVSISDIKNKVEHSPYIKGVISLRNELIPIVDLKNYLNGDYTQIDKDSRIIILSTTPVCGIIVDSIKEVIHYEIDKLLPISKFENNLLSDSFSNIIALSEDRNIIKIDLTNLFSEDAKKQLEAGIHLNKDYDNKQDNTNNYIENENMIRNKDYILFKIGEIFALEISEFQEIINYSSKIIDVPNSEDYLEGILNLRGEPIFIVNLRKYYSIDDYPNKNEIKILILNSSGKKIGIMVDEIIEILKTDKVQVERSPRLASRNIFASMQNHISEILMVKDGRNKDNHSRMVIVLDNHKLTASLELNERFELPQENELIEVNQNQEFELEEENAEEMFENDLVSTIETTEEELINTNLSFTLQEEEEIRDENEIDFFSEVATNIDENNVTE